MENKRANMGSRDYRREGFLLHRRVEGSHTEQKGAGI